MNIIYDDIYVFEHFGCRFACFAEDRVHRHSGARVDSVVDVVASIDVATHAMFGSKESNELYIFGFVENVDSRFEMRVDASRVGDETDAFAFEDIKVLVAKNFDATLAQALREAFPEEMSALYDASEMDKTVLDTTGNEIVVDTTPVNAPVEPSVVENVKEPVQTVAEPTQTTQGGQAGIEDILYPPVLGGEPPFEV